MMLFKRIMDRIISFKMLKTNLDEIKIPSGVFLKILISFNEPIGLLI